MVFASGVFLFLFLPIILCFYYAPFIKSIHVKNIFLLFGSLVFYAWGEPIFFFLMLFSILVTYYAGVLIEKFEKQERRKKTVLAAAAVYDVAILFVFKYVSFLTCQFAELFHLNKAVDIGLPIGVSFFTFQMMSYIFDVYYGTVAVQHSMIKLALYISLFPQLIAGPIVRYENIEKELDTRSVCSNDVYEGLKRFIFGLGKKVLLADYLAIIADNIFDYTSVVSVANAWMGAIAYSLQIFFDFSGYSDMAIGLGRMFGFHFPENFNYPYISKSVTEFWRRWHISLSGWFRDYVYIPLGGNRVSKLRWVLNMAAVWLLTGIWHGANWTFLIWGAWYLLALLIEKSIGGLGIDKGKRAKCISLLVGGGKQSINIVHCSCRLGSIQI